MNETKWVWVFEEEEEVDETRRDEDEEGRGHSRDLDGRSFLRKARQAAARIDAAPSCLHFTAPRVEKRVLPRVLSSPLHALVVSVTIHGQNRAAAPARRREAQMH